MLRIIDDINPQDSHEFQLSNIRYDSEWVFELASNSQPSFILPFKVPFSGESYHQGYSTSVFLLKNSFFAQKHVIEIRIPERKVENGRIGFIIQLNSIFDSSIITYNKHLFSFVYYALGNIFYNSDFKQTKIPTFSKSTFSIEDFFDDDTLLLILCDQHISAIPGFKIDNYLPSLYKHGFYLYDSTNRNSYYNISNKIENNYCELSTTKNKYNYYSLTLNKISDYLLNEDYITNLFKKHILQKVDSETRFLLLYQIIELLISKVLTVELNKKVCNSTKQLESFDLKSMLDEIVRENQRISLLLSHPYSRIPHNLIEDLKREIYSFLQSLGFSKYSDTYDSNNVKFPGTFYDYRNKLLHNHRTFKSTNYNEEIIFQRMQSVNSLVEQLVIELIISYNE